MALIFQARGDDGGFGFVSGDEPVSLTFSFGTSAGNREEFILPYQHVSLLNEFSDAVAQRLGYPNGSRNHLGIRGVVQQHVRTAARVFDDGLTGTEDIGRLVEVFNQAFPQLGR